jgi:hypothetical protein
VSDPTMAMTAIAPATSARPCRPGTEEVISEVYDWSAGRASY